MSAIATASRQRTHVRWVPILALVAVGTMINYLDRTVLGIAAPFLTADLGLTAAKMGLVFSAFSWSYALLQIPGGIFLDRFGTRVTYFIAVVAWSLCTALMGVVRSLNGLILTRIGVGIFEAPCFPANSRILATWFPQHERARANSIYSFGQYVGLGFLSVPLFWITQRFGWRGLFFIVGGLGVAFGIVWWALFRNPAESRTANQAEIDYIEAGGGGEYKGAPVSLQVALHRPAAAVPPGGGRVSRTIRRQLDAGLLRHLVSDLSRDGARHDVHSGRLHDVAAVHRRLDRRARGRLAVRRDSRSEPDRPTSRESCRSSAACCWRRRLSRPLSAPAGSNSLVMLIMSIAFFGQGMTNLGWTVVSDIAPKKLIGLTSGIFNFSANLAGIVTPLVIGITFDMTGSFVGPLVYIGVVALVGAFSYSVILGDIHRLDVATD